MESKELRLGNLVKYNEEIVEVIKIFEIHLEVHSDVFQFWTDEIENFNGVPITEEILLKCGFVETSYHQYTLGEQTVSLSDSDGLGFWIMGTELLFRRKYLHELQNLWFTFYGKHLDTSKLLKHG